eukprot:NODE_559_length_1481_cov_392.308555.p1 GENE.NODE_559_length_1481_cov_392.308555~~NODE_559_length_1481_cov_392.308555.p1  ORF type:complete len:438 (+),score=107.47 NODE_559_length_1481_cov_392.308555:77-1315(+)
MLPECSVPNVSDELNPPREHWKLPPRYQLRHMLGSGAYGAVAAAWDEVEERVVAIKRIPDVFENAVMYTRIHREVSILSGLKHKNIVKILNVPQAEDLTRFDALYMVMERCDTDLERVCRESLAMAQVRQLSCGLVLAIAYLHSAGVYHRDLKPANCLANRDCSVKVCDFNLSRVWEVQQPNPPHNEPKAGKERESRRQLTRGVASRWYRAPEVVLGIVYTEMLDVWSVGCCIYELLNALRSPTGKRFQAHRYLFPGVETYPLDHRRPQPVQNDMLHNIFDIIGTPAAEEINDIKPKHIRDFVSRYGQREGCGIASILPVEVGEEGVNLLTCMLRFTPRKRCSMHMAIEHPFFMRASYATSLGDKGESEMRAELGRWMEKFEHSDRAPQAVDRPRRACCSPVVQWLCGCMRT